MKIIHISDTHLGIGIENTSREDDFYNNFELIINDIIKIKPDYLIHTGDLFHTAKPSNKAISIVVKNFIKLSDNNIKTIVIAGNHDTPRLSTTTHSFEIFKEIKGFFTFYEPTISGIQFDDINFVCLPHIHNEDLFKEQLKKSGEYIIQSKKNIFLSHFGIQAREYEEYTDEISGINIEKSSLENLKKYDYVALGHYHKNFCIGNMCYSGSIEHTSFNQKDYNIGYNIIEINDKVDISKKYIKTRLMIDLGNIDCDLFNTTNDLIINLKEIIKTYDIKKSILKLAFVNMNTSLILDFKNEEIKELFKDCEYFEFKKVKQVNKRNKINIKGSYGNIIENSFDDFIKTYTIDSIDIDKVKLKKELKQLLNY